MIDSIVNIIGNVISNVPIINKALINYKKDSLRIVYYHIVSEENPDYYFKNKAISINNFKAQIKYLKKHFEVISLEEAIGLANNHQSLSKKLVITFDDGLKKTIL